MRDVLWKASASQQFRAIFDYIGDRNDRAAVQLEAEFLARIQTLAEWPGIGRPGRIPGTREFILHPNYIIIYQVKGDQIIILRVLHARQPYP